MADKLIRETDWAAYTAAVSAAQAAGARVTVMTGSTGAFEARVEGLPDEEPEPAPKARKKKA